MDVPLSRKFYGKKYMWDGLTYDSRDQAQEAGETYKKDGFEVETIAEGELHLVFTRRLAGEQASGN
jgi:hypothetical protein